MKNTFIYNFPRIIKELKVEGMANSSEGQKNISLKWLEVSHKDPSYFWRELFNFHSSRFQPLPKSSLGEGCDFYHDLILRHIKKERLAFCYYQDGWKKYTYDELHRLASRKACQWTAQGITQGQTLCMILPMGLKYVVSLLAGLKMGLVLSYLPPYGDHFLARRLENLGPDFIITEEIYTLALSGFEDLILHDPEEELEEFSLEGSYTYDAQEHLGRFFSPLHNRPEIPHSLLCERAYLQAMVDGTLVFDLAPERHLCAPDLDPLLYHPSLLLATFFSGATYVQLTLEDIEKKPSLLLEHPNLTLGVHRNLREILLKNPISPGKKWTHWFRNPAEPVDWERWQFFLQTLKLEKIPCSNLLIDASFGGILLFSLKRNQYINWNVLPSPGTPWILADVNRSGQEAYGSFGLYSPEIAVGEEEPPFPTEAILLSRWGLEWFFAGSLEPRRAGKTYPVEEVMATISHLPFMVHSTMLALPIGGETNGFLFILLAFLGPEWGREIDGKKEEWTSQIYGEIHLHLAREFLPDKVEFYPFYAREVDGRVDENWCRAQYLTGGFHRKTHEKIHQLLARIRYLSVYRS